MSGGFEVHPEALDKAAAVFDDNVDVVKTNAGEFSGAAKLPDSAFGNLPDSYKLANGYQAFYNQVQTDMQALQDGLKGGAERLKLSAKNYRQAEADSTLPSG